MMPKKRLEEMREMARPAAPYPTPEEGARLRVALRDAVAEIEELNARLREVAARIDGMINRIVRERKAP